MKNVPNSRVCVFVCVHVRPADRCRRWLACLCWSCACWSQHRGWRMRAAACSTSRSAWLSVCVLQMQGRSNNSAAASAL